ncbi:MAG: YitT family protein [Candidatus Ornithospirochaeta sp.]|nr:YitT family protein [Candidatus Ornithospirochaeta sp.]
MRKHMIIDLLQMAAGSAIASLGIALFEAPARIAPGGVSGISTIMHYAFGLDVGLGMLMLSIPVFLIGLRLFGSQYGIMSLIGSVLLSLFTSLWTLVLGSNGILDYSRDISTLLSVLFGGVLAGAGLGLVIRSGSNTGGTDIIAQILARYTGLSVGNALFIVDGIIIAASAFTFGIESALYAVICSYITALAINRVVLSMGTGYAKTVYIISDNLDAIGKYVTESLDRGGTIVNAKGLFTNEARPMLMTVIPNQDISRLTRFVKETDSKAFLIIQETVHVLGEGYTPIEKVAESNDVTQR